MLEGQATRGRAWEKIKAMRGTPLVPERLVHDLPADRYSHGLPTLHTRLLTESLPSQYE